MRQEKWVWVFLGTGADAPSGIFETEKEAKSWIQKNEFQGILYRYPLGVGVFDMLQSGGLKFEKDYQKTTMFAQNISPGYLQHDHFE